MWQSLVTSSYQANARRQRGSVRSGKLRKGFTKNRSSLWVVVDFRKNLNSVYWLTQEEEAAVAKKMMNFSQKSSRSFWAQHIHFLHFDEKPPPLYVNLVREPVERLRSSVSLCISDWIRRFISHFYFRRFLDNGKKKRDVQNGMINEGFLLSGDNFNYSIKAVIGCSTRRLASACSRAARNAARSRFGSLEWFLISVEICPFAKSRQKRR